ncbi:MAG: hypothetical protein MUF42_03390 [Cytophagaceae bacterium]|jgi:hypothetical protein|nr:hypothetical protein [Cytophagaceae bacterium]
MLQPNLKDFNSTITDIDQPVRNPIGNIKNFPSETQDGESSWIQDPWPLIPTLKYMDFETDFFSSIPSDALEFRSRFSTEKSPWRNQDSMSRFFDNRTTQTLAYNGSKPLY